MTNLTTQQQSELIQYFDAYFIKLNALMNRRETLRSKSADPVAFDERYHACMEHFQEATHCLEIMDLVYLENLIVVSEKFLDSEQLS